jgi:hypothetical protein
MTHLEGGTMLRRLVRILFVVALGTALGITLAVPAVAQEPPITATVTGAATLVAKGAAVDVEISYTCSPDTDFAFVGVALTERVGGGLLATGHGGTEEFVCDGAAHTTTAGVTADGDRPFKKGDAVAQVGIEACSPSGCFFGGPPPATVRIR